MLNFFNKLVIKLGIQSTYLVPSLVLILKLLTYIDILQTIEPTNVYNLKDTEHLYVGEFRSELSLLDHSDKTIDPADVLIKVL